MSKHNLISLKDVMARARLSKTKIYRLISDGEFPAPVKIGRASNWVESEIDEWISGLIRERDAA